MTESKPRQRRKEARPAELLEAALDVFVERGFAATRLDEIAVRAGVSKGTLYLYFESKEALFKAVIQASIIPRIAEGEALVAQGTDHPDQLLRELIFGWWEVVGNSKLGGIQKLMMAESRNFPDVAQYYFDNVILRGRQLIVAALEMGMKSGDFRRADPVILCQIAIAPVLMATMWRQSFALCEPSGMSYGDYLNTSFDILMNGLRCVPHIHSSMPVKGASQ